MPQTFSAQIELFAREDKPRRVLSKARLPTNTTTDWHPVHRWFNFIAGFSPEFVNQCCDSVQIQSPRVLLDPFAGCGTAAVVAKQRGMDSISFDPHPIFARIARAKVGSASPDDVERIERAIVLGLDLPGPPNPNLSDAAIQFLSKLFPPTVLQSLLSARTALVSDDLTQSDLAFLMLSKVVEMSTHSQTDGIYKAPTTKKRAISPSTSCSAVAHLIREDLQSFGSLKKTSSRHDVFEHSSTDMSKVTDNSADIVVTSPPYLNNFDYAEMTRMLLYFWGIADSWEDITSKVRSRLIVNTTTALKGHKEKQHVYRACIFPALQCKLAPIVDELASLRTQKAGKKEYDFLVYPYFAQMTEVLRECHRCLKPGAPMHIMVADAALYGVHISTPQFLTEILEDIGFRDTRCEFVRRRGHRWILAKREGSEKGLGEYHVFGTK